MDTQIDTQTIGKKMKEQQKEKKIKEGRFSDLFLVCQFLIQAMDQREVQKALKEQRFKEYSFLDLHVCPDPIRFPMWFSDKKSTCQCRRHRFNPWVRNIPWRREWLLQESLQDSCLGNRMDRGAWQAAIHGVTKSWTSLTD